MRYRLRTLLIVLAIGPPLIAGLCSVAYLGWVWSQGFIGTVESIEDVNVLGPAMGGSSGERHEDAIDRNASDIQIRTLPEIETSEEQRLGIEVPER